MSPARVLRAKALGVSIDDLPDGRGKHGNQPKGSQHKRWKGGRTHSSHGYVLVRLPEGHHLRSVRNGCGYEHRIVAEKKIKRRLKRGEVVHHVNGEVDDNRPENLEVMTRGEHKKHHNAETPRDSSTGRFLPA